ncbi:hypothetical protein [uncultured Alistipes sp.]|uniref:hypothetical protein n=2 Tax=uncultured Alistipes sp. TaxID=538949 RepID=UPI00266CD838|nr:hypothetical protein [uncultured Alistipes sp.]
MDLTEIEPLLVRYFNNELSSAEAEKVAAWIAGSEEHRKTAEHLYYINLAAEAERLHREIDPAEALRKVHRRIRSDRWHRTFHRLERIVPYCCSPSSYSRCSWPRKSPKRTTAWSRFARPRA